MPKSTLKKWLNFICYHTVQEAVVMDKWLIMNITTKKCYWLIHQDSAWYHEEKPQEPVVAVIFSCSIHTTRMTTLYWLTKLRSSQSMGSPGLTLEDCMVLVITRMHPQHLAGESHYVCFFHGIFMELSEDLNHLESTYRRYWFPHQLHLVFMWMHLCTPQRTTRELVSKIWIGMPCECITTVSLCPLSILRLTLCSFVTPADPGAHKMMSRVYLFDILSANIYQVHKSK